MNQDIELETTLVICSISPYHVADEIAALEVLAGYTLREHLPRLNLRSLLALRH